MADRFELIRQKLEPDGRYLVSDGSNWGSEIHWLRFELAPRRPYLVSRLEEGREVLVAPEIPRDLPIYVRSEPGQIPPVLLDPVSYFSRVPTIRPRVEDAGILAGLDLPEEGQEVTGETVVEGWHPEGSERPGFGTYFKLDGEWRLPDVLEGEPSGRFRARFSRLKRLQGSHELIVLAVTEDSRFKRLGPRRFVCKERP
jgi:hypothetical protein